MKKAGHIFLTIALSASVSLSAFAVDYNSLSVKASRFYQYDEWASALAMYQLMLDKRPDDADTYCHAIVAASMEKMQDEPMRLLEQSLNARVPLDSIYNGVRRLAFEQGDAQLYVQFLENVGKRFPWMQRNIDARLLEYYTWRRDGRGMVEYAGRMLQGMPDNINFLTSLADGYFALGLDREAVDAYTKVIALNPHNYHALLVLGNYYENVSRQDRFNDEARVLSRQYLERAQAIHPTPHVATLLAGL